MSDRALYYPYIHIRDVRWLKANLLLFSQIRRMVPESGPQPDDGPVSPFTLPHGGRDPLLEPADLRSKRARIAQEKLAKRLREDAEDPEFKERFGLKAIPKARPVRSLGFQIHQAKLDPALKSALRDTGLAGTPGRLEPYGEWKDYIEVHHRVGQAVMSTLAVACATADGLDIVGDKHSGDLHECLIRKDADRIYEAWLKPDEDDPGSELPDPRKPGAHDLFTCMVKLACDTSKLDVQALAEMTADRAPIQDLMRALADRAANLAPMDPGTERDKQFREEVSGILRKWEANRRNMHPYWKRFFGLGLLEPGAKFLGKAAAAAAGAAPAAAAGVSGAAAGLTLSGPMLAAGAGLGIGLFAHAAKTYHETVTARRSSPYRYLTIMEKKGMIIRLDAPAGNDKPETDVSENSEVNA